MEKLNFNVFSPIHDVGIGKSKEIAQKDLKGLDESDSVFAILNGYDPGTVFEIPVPSFYFLLPGIPCTARFPAVSKK